MQRIIITLNEINSSSCTMDISFDPKIGTKEGFFEKNPSTKRLQIVAAAVSQLIIQKIPEIIQQAEELITSAENENDKTI